MKPTFFATPSAFRAWLDEHHDKRTELLVGFYKKASGKASITWPQSVDEALCYGWIDGVRKTIDDVSYTIRFTPRKPTSIWSMVNINRAHELIKAGLMRPAGLKAFERRDEAKSALYSYEQRHGATFPDTIEKQFQANKPAWDFFRSQAPSYQRIVTHWISSAKREETRQSRFAILLECSAKQRRIDLLKPRA